MRDQSDVELIREAFQRWNERDIEYWIRHAHPDVEIWSKYASLDEGGGPYRGHAGLREWRAEIDRRTQGSPRLNHRTPLGICWLFDRHLGGTRSTYVTPLLGG